MLDVYVFGGGEYGELGLGPKIVDGKKPIKVKCPRLNKFLDAKTVGIVQIAVGGMHCVSLNRESKILTWGVNDDGALGRDTKWEAPTRDIDAESNSDDDEDCDLSPKESTPTAIPTEFFSAIGGESFVQVAATDSASFALSSDGSVYGWGTFRVMLPVRSLAFLIKIDGIRAMMVYGGSLRRMLSKQKSLKTTKRNSSASLRLFPT